MTSPVSPRAVQVVDDIARRWGEDLGDGIVRISRKQASMAADLGCSAGTLAWYLRNAGPGVLREGGEIVIDRNVAQRPCTGDNLAADRLTAALVEHFGHPGPDGLVELLDSNGRPPTTRAIAVIAGRHHSTIGHHLARLETRGEFHRLGRRLFLRPPRASVHNSADHPPPPPQRVAVDATADSADRSDPGPDRNVIAELSHTLAVLAEGATTLIRLAARPEPRLVVRQIAETREMADNIAGRDNKPVAKQLAVDPEKTRFENHKPAASCSSLPPPAATSPAATATAKPRQPPPDAKPVAATNSPASSAEELAAALAPLIQTCHRLKLPATIDDKGSAALCRHSPAALAAAVAETLRLVATGELAHPIGFLVSRALKEPSFFTQALHAEQAGQLGREADTTAREWEARHESYDTNDRERAESRWLAAIVEEHSLKDMVVMYRARQPRSGDPATVSMAAMIAQSARDAVAAHPDVEPADAVKRFTVDALRHRLAGADPTAATQVRLPQLDTGAHLGVRLRALDRDSAPPAGS